MLDDPFLARRISDAGADLLQSILHQRYRRRASSVMLGIEDESHRLQDAAARLALPASA